MVFEVTRWLVGGNLSKGVGNLRASHPFVPTLCTGTVHEQDIYPGLLKGREGGKGGREGGREGGERGWEGGRERGREREHKLQASPLSIPPLPSPLPITKKLYCTQFVIKGACKFIFTNPWTQQYGYHVNIIPSPPTPTQEHGLNTHRSWNSYIVSSTLQGSSSL